MPDACSGAEVLALARKHAMTNVQGVARCLGSGTTAIYDSIERGDWTLTRVYRVGRKILIPTADIVAALGLAEPPTAEPPPVVADHPARPGTPGETANSRSSVEPVLP